MLARSRLRSDVQYRLSHSTKTRWATNIDKIPKSGFPVLAQRIFYARMSLKLLAVGNVGKSVLQIVLPARRVGLFIGPAESVLQQDDFAVDSWRPRASLRLTTG